MTTTTVDGLEEFHDLVGKQIGYSEWQTITQERVNLFADATDDHQWIHVDPEAAKEGPFGGPIAHGYLTLSLGPVLLNKILGDPRHDVRRQLRGQQGPLPLAGARRLASCAWG